jgi:hypothetical protein
MKRNADIGVFTNSLILEFDAVASCSFGGKQFVIRPMNEDLDVGLHLPAHVPCAIPMLTVTLARSSGMSSMARRTFSPTSPSDTGSTLDKKTRNSSPP